MKSTKTDRPAPGGQQAGPVDIVLPWVDGADPEWRRVRDEYAPDSSEDGGVLRYRDWDNLQYVFRGIEKFLPWVRQVHLVTAGHLPAWLEPDAPGLHVVRHQDYIPAEYLPTFSSHVIELNLHRIEGLAERFIYTNDDIFFLRPMEPDFFFREGLPADFLAETAFAPHSDFFSHVVMNDVGVLNDHFDKKKVSAAQRGKWFCPAYGGKAVKNILMQEFRYFSAIENTHLATPVLKGTMEELWREEPARLDKTCRNRFRSLEDVNFGLVRYWQLVSGRFAPTDPRRGHVYSIGPEDETIFKVIAGRAMPMVCLNDDDPSIDFAVERERIRAALDSIPPSKSRFEK